MKCLLPVEGTNLVCVLPLSHYGPCSATLIPLPASWMSPAHPMWTGAAQCVLTKVYDDPPAPQPTAVPPKGYVANSGQVAGISDYTNLSPEPQDAPPAPQPEPSTAIDALSAIEDIVGDDSCALWEHDAADGTLQGAKDMQEKICNVYRIAHGFNTLHSCHHVHGDWRAEVTKAPPQQESASEEK